MSRDTVDAVILAIREHQRINGQMQQSFQELMPLAEAIVNSGLVQKEVIHQHIDEWNPVINMSALGRLSPEERMQLEAEIAQQSQQARQDLRNQFD